MASEKGAKAELFTIYPLFSTLIYNGNTVLHFLLGGIGIAIGYGFLAFASYVLGFLYFALSMMEMYVLMPLKVCPNCVYYPAKGSVCISGLNVISRKIASAGDPKNFPKRAEGHLCPNNLYLASLVFPKIACIHCRAKYRCPQAELMGVRSL